jgi:hypothetical protein
MRRGVKYGGGTSRRADVHDSGNGAHTLSPMPADEPLQPFEQATLRQLIEESRRLRKQSEQLRRRAADLDKLIEQRTREGLAPDLPPTE